MTRARALKQVIRARAARTGERYTTARRHELEDSQQRSVAQPRALAELQPRIPSAAGSKGGPSDASTIAKTGHGFDHWFAILDRFDAVKKGHTAAAQHLRQGHHVDGWYAQGITLAYERARGVRAANQRFDGVFEVSASKVIAADAAAVIKALTDPRRRRRLSGAGAELLEALWAALDSPASKGFVVRPDGLGRFRYQWDGTTVQLYLLPKPGGKVSVVATNAKLEGPAMVEERRAQWRALLNALAASLT